MEITVKTTAELREAFADAKDGDVIKLAAGDYGWTRFEDRDFDTGVTITSVDPKNPAVFDVALHVHNVSGLNIENIELSDNDLAKGWRTSRLFVQNSKDISLSNMKVEGHIPTSSEGLSTTAGNRSDPIIGYGHEIGLRAENIDGLVVRNVEFTDLRIGITLAETQNASLEAVEVHNVREGVNIRDVDNISITDSYFHDFTRFHKDHADMIQYWGANSTTGVHNITIDNNLFIQSDDWTQTIFGHMRAATKGVTATDFTITNNTVVNGHVNAIRLGDVKGFEISNNLVLPNDPKIKARYIPAIYLTRSSEGSVYNNTVVERNSGKSFNLSRKELAAKDISTQGNVFMDRGARGEGSWRELLKEVYASRPTSQNDNDTDQSEVPTSQNSDADKSEQDEVVSGASSGSSDGGSSSSGGSSSGSSGGASGDGSSSGSSGGPSESTSIEPSSGLFNTMGTFGNNLMQAGKKATLLDRGSEASGGLSLDVAANGGLLDQFAEDPAQTVEIWSVVALGVMIGCIAVKMVVSRGFGFQLRQSSGLKV